MEAKKLEIQTLSVQIKVLTVDRKKFTKSVFNQLHWASGLDIIDFEKMCFNTDILGYVRVVSPGLDSRVVICVIDGLLFRVNRPDVVQNSYYRSEREKAIVKIWNTLTPDKQLFISI